MFSRSVGADDLLIVREKWDPFSRRHSSTLHMRFRSKYFRLDESAGNAVRAHTHGHQTWCEFFSFFSALLPCGVENEPAKLGTPPFKTRQTPQGERLEYQSYLRNAGQIVPHSLEVLTVQPFASRHEFVVILKKYFWFPARTLPVCRLLTRETSQLLAPECVFKCPKLSWQRGKYAG